MRILVTGANGQVGHCLSQTLMQQGITHLALTRNQLDISNAQAVSETIDTYQPDIVINAAAYTAVDKAESDGERAFAINRDGAANLATACAKVDAAIFHISTDYVFSGTLDRAYREEDPTAPQGVYGQSKLEGELAIASINQKHIILRTAWVFGEHGNNFVKTMLRLGQERDHLRVVADQMGGPTYSGDISSALIAIASEYASKGELAWGTYHYSGFPHCSWHDFACEIFACATQQKLYAKSVPTVSAIATADYPTPAKRPANSRLDCSRIQQTFGIQPSNWQQALENLAQYTS